MCASELARNVFPLLISIGCLSRYMCLATAVVEPLFKLDSLVAPSVRKAHIAQIFVFLASN